MSARRQDLDLSLSGSQIMSARSNKSNRPSTSSSKPVSSHKTQPKAKPSNSTSSSATPITSLNRGQNQRQYEDSTQSALSTRGLSEEFLAFFESQGARPKVRNKSPDVKKRTMKAVFPGSASSTPRTARSRQASTAASNQTRHSIFRSETPRSVSTVDDDYDLSSSRYSPVSTARSKGINSAQDDTSVLSPRNNQLEIEAGSNSSGTSTHRQHTRTKLADAISNTNASRTHSLAITSEHKHLNAANNMLAQSLTHAKPTKLELRTMQNSYQNPTYNVNKTPVNEIQSSGHPLQSSVSKNQAEDYIKKVNMAASIIQHSFKRYVRHRKAMRASQAAMKRILLQKKEEVAQRQNAELVKTEERKKIKNLKAGQVTLSPQSKSTSLTPKAASTISSVSPRQVKSPRQTTKSQNDFSSETKCSSDLGQLSKSFNKQQVSPRSPASPAPVSPSPLSMSQNSVNRSGIYEPEKSPPPATPEQSGTRTTLEDLMSTLKQLEEEEQLPMPPETKAPSSVTPPLNSIVKSNSPIPDEKRLSRPSTANSQSESNKKSASEEAASTRLQNILSFLDEVETKDQLDSIYQEPECEEDVGATAALFAAPPGLVVPSAQEMEQMEQASAAASEVTSTVLKQRLQLEEKNRTVQMLQKALNQQRELTIRHAKETEKELNKRLDVQKSEYEEAVQRHLNFIDQLIDDKKSLGDKCESLVTEMKQMEKKYSDKIKSVQDSHDQELAKVKDMILAKEKIRREKWIEEKSKKIKDLTVKGLEPEIQRLINKHKDEKKKMKAIHEAELLASDERAGQRYISMTEELRDQLAKEKEMACQRERELAAQRYEKQLQAEEEAYQQTRRRLYQEIQDEKERLSEQAIKQKQDMDRLRQQLEETHSTSSSLLRKEYEKSREDNNRKHEAELNELKERLAADKEAWEQNHLKKQEAWMVAKEREIKESLRQERDREIEMVICRLEDDGEQARLECERTAESRIKRIREKYERELEELEKSERQAIEKHNSMKAELLDATGENERLKVLLKQKEREVDDVKRLSEKLHNEREHVSDVVRQEFADKIVFTNEENKRIKIEMAELQSQHKIEIERMKQEIELVNRAKQEEMDAVHSRVKQAIAKKEEVVQQLRQQHQAALKRADHLEGLLEQQRRQLLTDRNKK